MTKQFNPESKPSLRIIRGGRYGEKTPAPEKPTSSERTDLLLDFINKHQTELSEYKPKTLSFVYNTTLDDTFENGLKKVRAYPDMQAEELFMLMLKLMRDDLPPRPVAAALEVPLKPVRFKQKPANTNARGGQARAA